MDTVGQEPQHIDFFVDSWNDAFKSESGITLRRAIGAHHESENVTGATISEPPGSALAPHIWTSRYEAIALVKVI